MTPVVLSAIARIVTAGIGKHAWQVFCSDAGLNLLEEGLEDLKSPEGKDRFVRTLQASGMGPAFYPVKRLFAYAGFSPERRTVNWLADKVSTEKGKKRVAEAIHATLCLKKGKRAEYVGTKALEIALDEGVSARKGWEEEKALESVQRLRTDETLLVWSRLAEELRDGGDPAWIAIREGLQNSRDAGASKFEVKRQGKRLSLKDNGPGMDWEVIESLFGSLGSSKKGKGDIGGFGMGRLALLFAGEWDWTLRTQQWEVRSVEGSGMVDILRLSKPVKGLEWELQGVEGLGSNDLRDLLELCWLPDLQISLNGRTIEGGYPKGKARKRWSAGVWSRKGGPYPWGDVVRIGGIVQFIEDGPAGFVYDLETSKTPREEGYPLDVSRQRLRASTTIPWMGRNSEKPAKDPEFVRVNGITGDDPGLAKKMGASLRRGWKKGKETVEGWVKKLKGPSQRLSVDNVESPLLSCLSDGSGFENAVMIKVAHGYPDSERDHFLNNLDQWFPLLIVWDVCSRIAADLASLNNQFVTGFVLEDGTRAMSSEDGPGGSCAIMVSPDEYSRVRDQCKRKGDYSELIEMVYVSICHELSHRGLMKHGHDETWAIQRERVAIAASPMRRCLEEMILALEARGSVRSKAPGRLELAAETSVWEHRLGVSALPETYKALRDLLSEAAIDLVR